MKAAAKRLVDDRPLMRELTGRLYRSLRGGRRQLSEAFQVLRWLLRRRFGAVDRALLRDYLTEHDVGKLHIGCGANLLDGWLNTDYFPDTSRAVHLNAVRSFPFPDACFDYVYSEHMIEHVSYADGERMLAECFRVLKPNGRVRIATPDLRSLLDLYLDPATPLHQRYTEWMVDQCTPSAPYKGPIFVLNHFVRAWGHRFVHDTESLTVALRRAGFSDITSHGLQESDDDHLAGLANEDRVPEGFLDLETLTLEAVKKVG